MRRSSRFQSTSQSSYKLPPIKGNIVPSKTPVVSRPMSTQYATVQGRRPRNRKESCNDVNFEGVYLVPILNEENRALLDEISGIARSATKSTSS
jgi:hypothetical protein